VYRLGPLGRDIRLAGEHAREPGIELAVACEAEVDDLRGPRERLEERVDCGIGIVVREAERTGEVVAGPRGDDAERHPGASDDVDAE
jgi:hypothetical protein